MGIEQYTLYTTNGTVILSTSNVAGDNMLHLRFGAGAPPRSGSVVRAGQAGVLRGGMECTIGNTPNNNFDFGLSFLHSVSNITAGATTSFYAVVKQAPNFRIYHFPSGANQGTSRQIATTSLSPGSFSVVWDANVSGLGGTRIIVTVSGVIIFDIMDIFVQRIASDGQGVFAVEGAGAQANLTCLSFAYHAVL